MRRWVLLLLLLAGRALAAPAEEPPLGHFASGYRLHTDGASAIYRLPLPAEVYRTVVRPDLGDIRVFNAAGERVPHAVRRPEPVRREDRLSLGLPVFPVSSEIERLRDRDDLEVMLDEDGRIIRITRQSGSLRAEPVAIRDYIIDLTGLDRGVDELAFELAAADGDFIRTATLQHSDDLNTWRPLVAAATLARLRYGGRALDKTAIKLPNRRLAYVRFHWLEGGGGPQLTGVRATLTRQAGSRDRRWAEVEGQASDGGERTWRFDTRGQFPVDRVNLRLPQANTLIEAVLRSRDDPEADWHLRHRGLFYHLRVQGNRLERGPVGLGPLPDRYWELEVLTRGGLGSEPPRLQFAWIPNDLYFLARGGGPFTLAFGNGRVDAPGRPIQALMEVLDEDQAERLTGEAELGDPVPLMGERALQPERAIPWERVLLWAVLVLGVAAIAAMAWRLSRQLD